MCGGLLDDLKDEASQVVDQKDALFLCQLLINGWSGMRFRAPQLQLRFWHIGSPGFASVDCRPDRL